MTAASYEGVTGHQKASMIKTKQPSTIFQLAPTWRPTCLLWILYNIYQVLYTQSESSAAQTSALAVQPSLPGYSDLCIASVTPSPFHCGEPRAARRLLAGTGPRH